MGTNVARGATVAASYYKLTVVDPHIRIGWVGDDNAFIGAKMSFVSTCNLTSGVPLAVNIGNKVFLTAKMHRHG